MDRLESLILLLVLDKFFTQPGMNLHSAIPVLFSLNYEQFCRRTGQRCFDGSTLSEVGFSVAANRFLVTHNVCHDEVAEATRYVYYMQTPANMGFQRSFPRRR